MIVYVGHLKDSGYFAFTIIQNLGQPTEAYWTGNGFHSSVSVFFDPLDKILCKLPKDCVLQPSPNNPVASWELSDDFEILGGI